MFDIVVVGAGPIGIAFACGFADSNFKIAIVDKLPRKLIANPKIDGREIALTHSSVKVLKKLDVWRHISNKTISLIKEARVLDGDSRYFLNFDYSEYSLVKFDFISLLLGPTIRHGVFQFIDPHTGRCRTLYIIAGL